MLETSMKYIPPGTEVVHYIGGLGKEVVMANQSEEKHSQETLNSESILLRFNSPLRQDQLWFSTLGIFPLAARRH